MILQIFSFYYYSMNFARVNSPSHNKPSTTTVRNTTSKPVVYEQRFEQIKQVQTSENPQTLSFGSNGIVHDKKTVNLPNKDVYEGQLNSAGNFHGFGRYSFTNKNLQYEGFFENGLQSGKGQLFKLVSSRDNFEGYRSGITQKVVVYEGEWKNGKKNGEGKYYYDGEDHYYQGVWQNDERHGNSGTYVGPIGTYVGKWKHGKMNGRGKLTVSKTSTIYSGDFQDNQFIRGLITYANGDEYNGEVKDGMRHDNQGRYAYTSLESEQESEKGIKYVGGWREDIKEDQSGEATVAYPGGQILKGTFKNGQFMESAGCKYSWPDKSTFKGWIKKQSGQYVFKGTMTGPKGKVYEV